MEIAELSQERIDAIVDAMAAAVAPQCEALARLAVEETGYGVVADKVQKNQFSADRVYRFIRPMKTVGVLQRLEDRKVVEIAEPFGVVAAIVPSTNPTSTAIYKILISLKARCAIVISPHPSAVRCITRVAEIMNEAARGAGAPEGSINWMTTVTLEGTQELMKSRDVAVILATGGMGLVRAAYSSGKPAYGVGPGNAPCYVEGSADIKKAASDIIIGKTFDNGLLCSSPNSVVVDTAIAEELKREFVQQGAYFLNAAEIDAVDESAGHAAAACRIRRWSAGRRPSSPRRRASACRLRRACWLRRSPASDATIRSRSRSCARCCRGTSCRTGARAASAARRFCDTAAWVTRCRFIRATIRSFSSSASRSRRSASSSIRRRRMGRWA